jgi:hypothetical protein
MNLFVKLSIVPIFFVPLIAGRAGTREEAKVVEQPSVKTTEPWRITVGGRGWLDLLGGFRYTYLGEQVGLQANNIAINTASTQLVNQFGNSLPKDHRAIKRRVRASQNFRSFWGAWRTISGYEAVHTIRKGQAS